MKIEINNKTYESLDEFVLKGRGCATTRPNHYQIQRNDERIAQFRTRQRPDRIDIKVHFIHLTDDERGTITEEQRGEQINILNGAFNSMDVFFAYSVSGQTRPLFPL